MRIPRSLILALTLLTLVGGSALAQDVVVTVTGQGAGPKASALDQAKTMALRQAVEQGCGVYINSKSQTRDFVLVKDQIYSESKGFVTKYDVLRETYNPAQQIGSVTIRATVSKKALEDKWMFYETTLERVGIPKVMFVTALKHEGKILDDVHEVENRISSALIDARIQVVDKGTLAAEKRRKMAYEAAQGNTESILAEGRHSKADVLIIGTISSRLINKFNDYGETVWDYESNYNYRIVRVTDGVIMKAMSKNVPVRGKGQSSARAFMSGINHWGKRCGEWLRREMMRVYAFQAQNYIIFNLEVRNIGFGHKMKLKGWLNEQTWVKNLTEDRYTSKIVIWRIKSKLTKTDQVAEKLYGQSVVKFDDDKWVIDKGTVQATVVD